MNFEVFWVNSLTNDLCKEGAALLVAEKTARLLGVWWARDKSSGSIWRKRIKVNSINNAKPQVLNLGSLVEHILNMIKYVKHPDVQIAQTRSFTHFFLHSQDGLTNISKNLVKPTPFLTATSCSLSAKTLNHRHSFNYLAVLGQNSNPFCKSMKDFWLPKLCKQCLVNIEAPSKIQV